MRLTSPCLEACARGVSDGQAALVVELPSRPTRPLGDAIPLFERTLAHQERILGSTDQKALTTRGNLASAYEDAGRLLEAERLRADRPT